MSGDDTPSRVALRSGAFDRWHAKASELVLRREKTRRPSVGGHPDELACVEAADGALTLYVPMPDGAELSMRRAARMAVATCATNEPKRPKRPLTAPRYP